MSNLRSVVEDALHELVEIIHDSLIGTVWRYQHQAHVLPDGRRVFKTIDGQKVFDEHGQELSPDTMDPNGIDDRRPRWEAFKAGLDERAALTHERRQILEYQEKLDETRERLDRGGLTENDLSSMKDELMLAAPERVRRKLDVEEPQANRPANRSAPALEEMEELVRATRLAPAGPG